MSPNNTLHSDGPRVARPAGERGVMRRVGVAVVLLALSGCETLNGDAPEAPGQCGFTRAEGWVLLEEPPPEFRELLAMRSGYGNLDSELRLPTSDAKAHEHWYKKEASGDIAICRHLVGPDACSNAARSVEILRVDGEWRASGVLELICVTGAHLVQPHNNALERTRER